MSFKKCHYQYFDKKEQKMVYGGCYHHEHRTRPMPNCVDCVFHVTNFNNGIITRK